MKLRLRHLQEEPGLNGVSMTDVVLMLLIFFMAATRLHHEPEFDIQLPSGSGQPRSKNIARLEISIDAAGCYAINGQWLPSTEAVQLRDALKKAANGREIPLTVHADGRTPHQAVVTVLDIGQIELRRLAIVTENDPNTLKPASAVDRLPLLPPRGSRP
ncbi:MAG: biopolymer transporter ExbD [Candidatus Contendobacter odensis]|uniref:Biopolymer transporter ExbD n=1 Tax=Candidatus Contendibacter odensensis TaxID=1400860 RepID=A0A2G6PH83_9GAMM|nr:MAG: biopolymer transporter ExbD [Candidatus Contendobacter odensis]